MGDPWIERWTDVDGPLFYAEWPGSRARTFVCVHGIGSGHEVWRPVATGLAEHGRVLAPDLPGFGRTSRAGRRTTPAALQRTLSRFIRAVADPPVVLVANSFGAAVAARQAADEPEAVAGLVLGSPYLPAYYGGVTRAPAVVVAMLLERVGGFARRMRQSLLMSALGVQPPTARITGKRHLPRRERLASQLQAGLPLAGWAVVPRLAWRTYRKIRAPVLLLHGEADPVVPVGWAYHANRRRPDWSLNVFAAVSHVAELGRPEWWLEDVAGWLGALDGAEEGLARLVAHRH